MVLTNLYLSEDAVDLNGLPIAYNMLNSIPLNRDIFVENIVNLTKEYLESDEFKNRHGLEENLIVENLLNTYHNWTHEDETIRVFLTDKQIQKIAFGEYYQLVDYVHDNNIIKEENSTGVWLYLIELLPEHEPQVLNYFHHV